MIKLKDVLVMLSEGFVSCFLCYKFVFLNNFNFDFCSRLKGIRYGEYGKFFCFRFLVLYDFLSL